MRDIFWHAHFTRDFLACIIQEKRGLVPLDLSDVRIWVCAPVTRNACPSYKAKHGVCGLKAQNSLRRVSRVSLMLWVVHPIIHVMTIDVRAE